MALDLISHSIQRIPEELLQEIFTFLPLENHAVCYRVNRAWLKACQDKSNSTNALEYELRSRNYFTSSSVEWHFRLILGHHLQSHLSEVPMLHDSVTQCARKGVEVILKAASTITKFKFVERDKHLAAREVELFAGASFFEFLRFCLITQAFFPHAQESRIRKIAKKEFELLFCKRRTPPFINTTELIIDIPRLSNEMMDSSTLENILENFPKLINLTVIGATTDEVLFVLRRPSHSPLTSLTIENCTDEDGFKSLALSKHLKGLEEIHLKMDSYDNERLECLSHNFQLLPLVSLTVGSHSYDGQLTDEGVGHLTEIAALTKISFIRMPHVSEAASRG